MQSSRDLASELEVARAVAREAAAVVLALSGPALEVRHKLDGEPVSRADLESSALIVARLAEAFPGDAILSEEVPDDGSRLSCERVWIIDPIDGTSDFVRGDSGYVVMIGLCHAGRPVLGVVAQPSSGELWSGVVGAGAWKEHPDGRREPVRVSTVRDADAIRLVASKSHRSGYHDRFRRALGITDELAIGSVGLKLALVAQATRDLYVYPGGQTKLWDSCAPEAILTAAGGRVTDSEGSPLCYHLPELRNPRGVVASNGLLHDLALATVARLRDEMQQETRG